MANRIRQIFWGWYVVLGAFLALCLSYGVRYSFGVFVYPMFQGERMAHVRHFHIGVRQHPATYPLPAYSWADSRTELRPSG